MFRKYISITLILICILSCTACGGNVKNVNILDYSSEIYSASEIQDAIDVSIHYFKKEFDDCTLTEITYYGDDKLADYQEFATRHNGDEVIVLVSTFETGTSGGDGSLNPNDTYTNWKWILVRTKGGKWRHVDHGY